MKPFEKQLLAEFFATFLCLTVACGTALFTMPFVGYLGVAMTFGLVTVALYSIFSKFSGCHMNPAVSLSFFIAKKIDFKTFLSYALTQLIAGLLAAGGLLLLFKSLMYCSNLSTFVTNGYNHLSPNHFGLWGCALVEILTTFMVCMAYLARSEDKTIPVFVLGATIVATHFFALPITGASLNPARSFGVAIVEGGEALKQVWFFFVMPMLGAFFAAYLHQAFYKK